MKRTIRKNLGPFSAILGLAAIGLLVGTYILTQQGARLPLLDEAPKRLHATLSSGRAVTPGQGQSVQVAGVKIGTIAGVKLREGRARLDLDIERRYVDEGLIRTDARAMLRPRTALKDMYLQVFPGSARAPAVREGFTLPVANTTTDVDLDEILSELGPRTRDYLTMLVKGTGEGLRGRGGDLAEVFKRYGPTARDLARVNRAVARERAALRRTISSLASLTGELAKRPRDLSELVQASRTTFGAFASEDDNLRDFVAELPATLRQATQTLGEVGPLARELGPASRALVPVVEALDDANARVGPAARAVTPAVRDRIRPFAREARPLVRDLAPAARDLAALTPDLRRAGASLNRFLNLLGFNKDGREAPGAPGRDEGYLYWLAYTAHNGLNLQSVEDANGPIRPIFLTGSCGTLSNLVDLMPGLEFGMGLSPLLATLCGDPDTASVDRAKARRRGR